MKTEQRTWSKASGWIHAIDNNLGESANLVFVFGHRESLEDPDRFDEIRSFYPNADIVLNSTAGEMQDTNVNDESLVLTAIYFEHTRMKFVKVQINAVGDSYNQGKFIAKQLPAEQLKHIFIISDGLKVNGSQLIKGVNASLPPKVTVTGGLAGDGSHFNKTLVGLNEPPKPDQIIAVGFYGERLRIGFGSEGGWDPFGPKRLVTKSKDNVLYEVDGQSILELYKKYLGDQAAGLPGTGLLFPLSIQLTDEAEPLVRTILAVDEKEQSLTFAGDIPMGAKAQLMKANFDRLIDGAEDAAKYSISSEMNPCPQLALLVSCVGRKLVLGQRIEEEVEMVREVLGERVVITGFYSYGEICPGSNATECDLHNQTMTITTFCEN